jgi:hypothetical protein
MFITENSMGRPTGTAMAEGSIANSLSMTSTVAGPAAACSVVPLPGAPSLHDAHISAMAHATLSVAHRRIDLMITALLVCVGTDMSLECPLERFAEHGPSVPFMSGPTARADRGSG